MTVSSDITTLTGMTRGYNGDFIRSLPLTEDRKEIHLEIISKALMLSCSFSEIPATLKWEKIQKGKAKRKSKFKPAGLIRSHLLFGFNEAPILLFGTLGFIVLLVGLILGLYLSFYLNIASGAAIVLTCTAIFVIVWLVKSINGALRR